MANLRFFSENSKKKMQKFEKPSNLPLLNNKPMESRRRIEIHLDIRIS